MTYYTTVATTYLCSLKAKEKTFILESYKAHKKERQDCPFSATNHMTYIRRKGFWPL